MQRASFARFLSALVACCLSCVVVLPAPASPRVVLNEVHYNPPDDRDDLQFVELHNPTTGMVSLAGWKLAGAKFEFATNHTIAPGGFLLVARDVAALRRHSASNAVIVGPFQGRLKRSGEQVQLLDRSGSVMDAVRYGDRAPWPLAADGQGSSLERITVTSAGGDPASWGASIHPGPYRHGGTPGAVNSLFATNLPPAITGVEWSTLVAQKPSTLTATVADDEGVRGVVAMVRVLGKGDAGTEQAVPMTRTGGAPTKGSYAAELPAIAAQKLVRVRIRAEDQAGNVRWFPAETEIRPALSRSTLSNTNTAAIPFAYLARMGGATKPVSRSSRRWQAPEGSDPVGAGDWTFFWAPPGGSEVEVFDFVHGVPRPGGMKVRFHKDHVLDEVRTLNFVFEGHPRFVLAEHLSFELFRRAGVPAPKSGHARLWYEGRPMGYHLWVEQPNSAFLRRNKRNPEGNLYKTVWYGDGLVGQHEKKTNVRAGHADLVKTVQTLQGLKGKPAQQWAYIDREFSVPEFCNYYAVNMCIQNWDGFFNNHYLHHDTAPGGKWEVYPWDEDKTWGYYDGASHQLDWYTMPLTFGMDGDAPSGGGFFGQRGFHGGAMWWRQPGWVSGPLLANAEFRKRFLATLRELCNTTFTSEQFLPVIRSMARQMRPEAEFRAAVTGQDRTRAVQEFDRYIESFERQLVKRREFILQALNNP